MALDFAGGLGGAASGASLGAEVGTIFPGIGNVVGGIVGGAAGFLGGLFGGGAKNPQYTDPFAGKINALTDDIMNDDTAEKQAGYSRSANERTFLEGLRTIERSPSGTRNLAALKKATGDLERQKEDADTGVNIAFGQNNRQNKLAALNAMNGQQSAAFGVAQYNQSLHDRPSFLQQVGLDSASTLIGNFVGSGGKGGSGKGGDDGSGGGFDPTKSFIDSHPASSLPPTSGGGDSGGFNLFGPKSLIPPGP